MRRTCRISLCIVGACLLYACAEARLGCGTDQVTSTLASMVRGHFLRVALDTYAVALDAKNRARLANTLQVTVHDARVVGWDTATGRLTCVGTVVIEAPGLEDRSTAQDGADLAYQVSAGNDGQFLVEVAYPNLIVLLAHRTRQLPARFGSPL